MCGVPVGNHAFREAGALLEELRGEVGGGKS
jgi:hypothetical protein